MNARTTMGVAAIDRVKRALPLCTVAEFFYCFKCKNSHHCNHSIIQFIMH